MKTYTVTATISDIIGMDIKTFHHTQISYNQHYFNEFEIVYYLLPQFKTGVLPDQTYFKNDEYTVQLSLTPANNIRASIKLNNIPDISVVNLTSKMRTIFEPNNPQISSSFTIKRSIANYEIGLSFRIIYKHNISIDDFKAKINSMFPEITIDFISYRCSKQDIIQGFIVPKVEPVESIVSSNTIEHKPIQYGLKDISQTIINKVFVSLAMDTKYQIINLLCNYAAKSNKELLAIHTDLGINRQELLDLLNIEKMSVTYDMIHKIASLNNKQVSVQII